MCSSIAQAQRSVNSSEVLEGRLAAAWRELSADDQERVLDLAERLAGKLKPRIIGEEE